VKVRPAGVGDDLALAALNRFVHDMHLARRPDYFKAAGADEAAAWFREQLGKPTTAAWIAEDGGAPIGYVLTFFHEREENAFQRARRWCEIDQIAVDPAWRRRGIGRALMNAALEAARARNVRDVELFSWAFNTEAHEMFQRFGFEPRVVAFERRAP
jgi:ribosomal protein S18 acetylase RimI-like enzyme